MNGLRYPARLGETSASLCGKQKWCLFAGLLLLEANYAVVAKPVRQRLAAAESIRGKIPGGPVLAGKERLFPFRTESRSSWFRLVESHRHWTLLDGTYIPCTAWARS